MVKERLTLDKPERWSKPHTIAREKLEAAAKAASPQFCEIIPLTLEEIFISEMEERGYDYSEVLF